MLRSRFPVTFLKGAIGLSLAVLLIAPVAVRWSIGPVNDPDDQGIVEPRGAGGAHGGCPPEGIAASLAFIEKSNRQMYDRKTRVWTPEMGSRRLGGVGVGEMFSPDTILLPMGKGAFNRKRPVAVAEGLRKN